MNQQGTRGAVGCRVALSGATGFVGAVVHAELGRRKHQVELVGRMDLECMIRGECPPTRLNGCAAAIHLAGRAHVLRENQGNCLEEYRRANRDTTLAFARACLASGVRRFVFVSSIHVNGFESARPFRFDDPPAPREPYARSKLDAERDLWELARQSGMEIVVVRPTLVYGPHAKANFCRLMKLAALPLPLPLASVSGKRSLIGVWNLADLLIRCIDHPAAPGRTLMAADTVDVALPELVRLLREGMGKPARLFPVPEPVLRMAARVVGMGPTFDKLVGTLQVDVSETQRLLDWTPPVQLEEGLKKTARWYVESRHGSR